MSEIKRGDFIRCKDIAFYGIVKGEGVIGKGTSVWTIDAGGGKIDVIPKRQAVLVNEEDHHADSEHSRRR